MKKIIFTLLAMSILVGASAQNKKCGIDTKALVAEEIASGATHINMLAKMVPNFDRGVFEKAGIVFGAQAGQIITLRVPVESLPLLESSKEVLEYSISHRIAAPECNNTRFDTRTDSVQAGLGLDIADTAFTGENVLGLRLHAPQLQQRGGQLPVGDGLGPFPPRGTCSRGL